MRVFSKYSPKAVSKVFLFNEEKMILVSEWLDNYVPLSSFFAFTPLSPENGAVGVLPEVGSDTCRDMGTLMGSSHARTHR